MNNDTNTPSDYNIQAAFKRHAELHKDYTVKATKATVTYTHRRYADIVLQFTWPEVFGADDFSDPHYARPMDVVDIIYDVLIAAAEDQGRPPTTPQAEDKIAERAERYAMHNGCAADFGIGSFH